jgi:GT2 family glycosyltransferase
MNIYAIIVTYNGIQWYDRCFNSLCSSVIPIKTIVIDNASSDNSVKYIKANYPEIILVESKENLGFAKANNLGLKYALENDADYVFLLNQDAWLNEKEGVCKMIELSNKHPEFGILSPLQLYGSGLNIEYETIMYLARNSSSKQDIISDLYFNSLKDIYEIPYVCAVSWLLPINTIKCVGGFDPIFYHYGEDDNYIQRVKYFGYKVAICPKVSISHDIEYRTKDYREENLNWKKYLLINLGNINISIDIHQLIQRKKRVIAIQLLRFNKKLLKQSYPEYLFLRKVASALILSRKQNKIKQANWL